jgi:hypothetical protein
VRVNTERWRVVRALLLRTVLSPILLALLPLGGCVLPVGPEFQDPPRDINQSPYFIAPPGGLNGFPFYEQTVTLSGMGQMFEAVVGDPNRDDTLSVRWVANYPPLSGATTSLMNQDVDRGSDGTGNSRFTVTCDMFMQGADRNLVVIVSDRGFHDLATEPAAHSNGPFNWNADGALIATMTGWRITGCP